MLVNQREITIQEDQRAAARGDLQLFKLLLQPHFLFNSLNNLYALSIKSSDLTSDAIAGLSELLEKVVCCSRKEFIPLSQELELINDYIKLERIWLGETGFLLDFQVTGDTGQVSIPPLLLYTFVENCFKHGARKCSGEGWICIKVEVKQNTIFFTTRNNVPSGNIHAKVDRNSQSGFGVTAARELLDRKCSGRFHLKNGQKGTIYSVELKLSKNQILHFKRL